MLRLGIPNMEEFSTQFTLRVDIWHKIILKDDLIILLPVSIWRRFFWSLFDVPTTRVSFDLEIEGHGPAISVKIW